MNTKYDKNRPNCKSSRLQATECAAKETFFLPRIRFPEIEIAFKKLSVFLCYYKNYTG